MTTKLKTLLLLLTVTSYTFAQQGGKNFIDQPYIEVTGTVETEITPNEIYLNIVLNENNTKGKKSVEDMENQMIATLKSLNIDLEKDFSILDFNGYFKRKFLGENEVTKTKHYELIVHDGKTLGKVYQALDSLNISNISITKIDHSDIENIIRETKLKALKTAKAKANDYAQAIDQTIGKAIFIQETFRPFNHKLYANSLNQLNEVAARGYSSESQEKIQDLNFKTITVSASVLVRFTIN